MTPLVCLLAPVHGAPVQGEPEGFDLASQERNYEGLRWSFHSLLDKCELLAYTSLNMLKNLKKTEGRLAVLSTLEEKRRPLSASEILEIVGERVDQATIYRILDVFNKNGIVRKLEFQEGKFRYELNNEDHHHLVCENCGRIQDIKDNIMHKWENEIRKTKGFIVKKHNLEFFGVCKKCQL